MESKQAWQMHQHLVFNRKAAPVQYGSIGQAQCKLPKFTGGPAGGRRWSSVLMWYTCSGTSQPEGVNQWGHGGWKGGKAQISRRLSSCFYCALGDTPKGLGLSLDKKMRSKLPLLIVVCPAWPTQGKVLLFRIRSRKVVGKSGHRWQRLWGSRTMCPADHQNGKTRLFSWTPFDMGSTERLLLV